MDTQAEGYVRVKLWSEAVLQEGRARTPSFNYKCWEQGRYYKKRKIVVRRRRFALQSGSLYYDLCSVDDGLAAAILYYVTNERFFGGYL